MAQIELRDIRKSFGGGRRHQGRRPRHRRRRVHGLRRPVGLRQVDAAAADRRPRGHHLRATCCSTAQRVNDLAPSRARHRHGVPVLCALPAHDGLREHGLRPEARRRPAPDEITAAGERGGEDAAASTTCSTGCRSSSPAASASAWRSAGPSCATRKVFLFDEPLSNLDAALRVATRIEIAKLHHEMDNVTMIYVTHDQVEAMTLADRICVLRDGLVDAGRHAARALRHAATRSSSPASSARRR